MQWGNAKGEPYTGNPYVRFDEGMEVVRPPPTLQRLGLLKSATLDVKAVQVIVYAPLVNALRDAEKEIGKKFFIVVTI